VKTGSLERSFIVIVVEVVAGLEERSWQGVGGGVEFAIGCECSGGARVSTRLIESST
jgi:hypothetical protein